MQITFGDLKECVEEQDDDFLLEYFNKFSGDNIYHKFINIIKSWEKSVSYTISFKVEDKNIKISLSYILEQLKNYSDEKLTFENSNIKVTLNTPPLFKKNINILSVSDFVYDIQYLKNKIDFVSLSDDHKNEILQSLPADFYNKLCNFILNITEKKVAIEHPSIPNLKIDFLSSTPYQILKELFLGYNIDYFRDVIYALSKKIDGSILMKSTMMDIDYYIDKIKNDNISDTSMNLS
jgi:hypothetical protein